MRPSERRRRGVRGGEAPRIEVDAAGTVIGRMDYDPFGAPLSPGVKLSSRAYAGLFRDGEAGLDFAQARSYQGRTGRCSTVDPISGRLPDPQAWNRYAYARNNPLSFTDPTGLIPQNCSSEPATTEGGRISVTITCGRGGSGRGGSAFPGGRNGDENELEDEPDDPTDDSDAGGPESPVPPSPIPQARFRLVRCHRR